MNLVHMQVRGLVLEDAHHSLVDNVDEELLDEIVMTSQIVGLRETIECLDGGICDVMGSIGIHFRGYTLSRFW